MDCPEVGSCIIVVKPVFGKAFVRAGEVSLQAGVLEVHTEPHRGVSLDAESVNIGTNGGDNGGGRLLGS